MSPLELGQKLADIRNEAKLKQAALAEIGGMSRQTLSAIERGRLSPHVDQLDKMLHACRWTLRRFFEAKAVDQYAKPAHGTAHRLLQELLEADAKTESSASTIIRALHTQYYSEKRQKYLKA